MLKTIKLFFLLYLTFASILYTASNVHADSEAGLNVEVYTFEPGSQPVRDVTQPLCEGAWVDVDVIDFDFDHNFGGVVAGCRQEQVIVHFTGFVSFPVSGNYSFLALADDGFSLTLDGMPVIEDWFDKGRWGTVYRDVPIVADHAYKLDAWFYENGGGANATLFYSATNDENFTVIPSDFYSKTVVEPPVPAFLFAPVNVVAVADVNKVSFSWDVSPDSGTVVERYALFWSYDDLPGWGVGVVGNSFVLENLPDSKEIRFWLRADNDLLQVYSPTTDIFVVTTLPKPVEPEPEPEPVVEPPVTVEPEPEPEVVDVVENVKPEPELEVSIVDVDLATIDPQNLTANELEALTLDALATFETAVEGSLEYVEALQQLLIVAQADDIVVDEQIAEIPVLGASIVAVVDAFNAFGNAGADMSPKVREKAEKTVVAAVIVTQIATTAVAMTATQFRRII